MKIIETERGLLVEVFVKPRSKQFKIVADQDQIVVHCREDPVRGKVNKELVKGFAKLFRRDVKLVSGFTSRQKMLLIKGADKVEVEKVLMCK